MTPDFLPVCCYFPSTILMVDDSEDLLMDLKRALAPHYKSKYSTSPQEIIKLLTQQGDTTKTIIAPLISTPEEQYDLSKTLINIDIPALQHIIYANPPRFSQHIILIVDYAMPEMNGLQLTTKIRQELGLPIKIIMLTGEADQSTAIKAFNEKLIDRFIVKSAPNYIDMLLAYTKELHQEYFKEISHAIQGSSTGAQQNPRNDPAFVELFNKVARQCHAVEYYQLEEPASFLFLDEKKNPLRLILKTEEDMQMLHELARGGRRTPPATVEVFEKRTHLAYFPDEESSVADAKDWKLLQAKPLEGYETYYYSLIEGNKDYPLDLEKIVSYQQFLNS